MQPNIIVFAHVYICLETKLLVNAIRAIPLVLIGSLLFLGAYFRGWLLDFRNL